MNLTCEVLNNEEVNPVEMSRYISIKAYDSHEEKHAYFIEMMEYIVSRIKDIQYKSKNTNPMNAFEHGAGTGHLTKRIAEIKNLQVLACELDQVCYQQLSDNLCHKKNLTILNKNTLAMDDTEKFDFICSSFADHHFNMDDKVKYFATIAKMLKQNGVALIGDEFLPEHDYANTKQRAEALNKYHNHIIDIAIDEGNFALAKLETQALDSGLAGLGDFKLSCSQYERLLGIQGLSFRKKKIGPTDLENFGGVYVYELTYS